MKNLKGMLAVLVAAGACLAPQAQAQVVREEGAKSIAGVLYTTPGQPTQAEWSFRSAGGQILFASLDADIYRVFGEHEEHEEAPAAAEDEGCSDEDDGGPGLFKLMVLDRYDRVVCSAVRPAPPPGWMRDPRMACVLPATGTPATYRLRVELRVSADHTMQPAYPFLLNLSLRRIASPGTNIESAIATSSAGGF